jgi:hypothetical protein
MMRTLPSAGSAVRRSLILIVVWTLLASAACLTTFAISTIPAPMPDGRNIPFWLEAVEALLAVTMIPACVLIPAPLLATVRRLLRSRLHVDPKWVTAWTTAGSFGVVIEGLFVWRLVRNLSTPFANLPVPSWHAFYFGIGFLVVGAGMTVALFYAWRSTNSLTPGQH